MPTPNAGSGPVPPPSTAAAASALALAQKVRKAWTEAMAEAAAGRAGAAMESVVRAESDLAMLLAPGGPLAAQVDGGRALLEELLQHVQVAAVTVESALRQTADSLAELEGQQGALRQARLGVERVQPQARWLDAKG